MQLVISSSLYADLHGELLKSQSASGAKPSLKGARRVGGHGASHEGSHWLREAATVKSTLGDYGVRDGIVVSKQTNQLKIWSPELGMFVVDARAVEPSQRVVQWDRKAAEAQTPVKGSVVNVRRPEDKSQWFGRLEGSLDDLGPSDTVKISRGTIGRKAEIVEVPRAHILGPHIPTKIKAADGAFVKDATSRRSAAPSRLQEALAPAAKWRDAPAIEWVHSLKRGRQAQIFANEDEWFKAHQDDVVRLAVAQSLRMGLTDPAQVEDVVSEAFYGALSALRLWAKRPVLQREMTRRKLLERLSPEAVEAMSDDELRTQRALMRAFAKAKAAVIPGHEDFVDAGALDWEGLADDEAERGGEPIYDGGAANFAASVIQTEIADAAKLSPGARYLLEHAIESGWALQGDTDTGPPADEASELAATLRNKFGVPHATEQNLPGMWLFVKNRLRDAVREDPSLLSTLHVPKRGRDQTLAKSLFTAEMVDAMDEDNRTQRISQIFSAFESSFTEPFHKSFDPSKHPHGKHGYWAHVFHDPSDDLFGAPAPKGLSPVTARAVGHFSTMLDQTYTAPTGYTWTVRPEHFVKLTCQTEGARKGVASKGQSESRAFFDLRDGLISTSSIPGFREDRAALLHLAPLVVSDPDFILIDKEARNPNDRLFYRRFQVHGRLVWVGMIVDSIEKKLRPMSFYNKQNVENDRFEPEWSYPGLTWKQNYTPRS